MSASLSGQNIDKDPAAVAVGLDAIHLVKPVFVGGKDHPARPQDRARIDCASRLTFRQLRKERG